MQYTIRTSDRAGDLITVFAVAATMAYREATAGGTELYEPTYNARLSDYNRCLIEEVRKGRLILCDRDSTPMPLDSIEIPPTEDINRPQKDDENALLLITCSWLCKLKHLNEWAEKRGDFFVLSTEGVGWFDDRGLVTPEAQQHAQPPTDHRCLEHTVTVEGDDPISSVPDTSEITPERWYETNRTARFVGKSHKYVQNVLISYFPNKKKSGRKWLIQGKDIIEYMTQYKQRG